MTGVTTTDDASLPAYDQLPIDPRYPAGSSWGLWGEDDVLGCLNLLSPETARRGLAAAGAGRVFPLDLPLDEPNPPVTGRSVLTHEVIWAVEGVAHDEVLSDFNTQSSTQWDGFRHMAHHRHGFYNGLDDERHGIDHWARRGIVTRAVLADVDRHRRQVGRPIDHAIADPIEPQDVTDTLVAQGSSVEPGDILLLRTGWLTWYRHQDRATKDALGERSRSPGLRQGEASARLLWDLHVAAVAADNPALEAWPPWANSPPEQREALRRDPTVMADIALHFALLPLLGLPIGELWDLDALAQDCAETGRYESLLTSAPLHLRAGVASPANALAIR